MAIITKSLPGTGGRGILMSLEDAGLRLPEWAEIHRDEIDSHLSAEGILLVRGLEIESAEAFGQLLEQLFSEALANYTYRSTPRTALAGNIYTATEYHHTETIPQHNENAYAHTWPMRIGFWCRQPAAVQGNTPVSDSRVAYQEIPREIREEFERKQVMYVRNYSNIDLPWTEVFQTRDKSVVEAFCDENNISYEWTAGGGLRTRQVNQATMVHPVTGDKLWFNQAHLFHVSSLGEDMQEDLLDLLGEENLPRNAFFGDGTPIDTAVLNIIREVYERTKFSFSWEKGDLLLLDNMLYTHGREPFEGTRQVLVGMGRPYRHQAAGAVLNA